MLKFSIRHGRFVDRDHEIFSFKQSLCLEKYKTSNTQKRNKGKNDFEKVSTNYSRMHSMEKQEKTSETE